MTDSFANETQSGYADIATEFAQEALQNFRGFLELLRQEGKLANIPCHDCQMAILAVTGKIMMSGMLQALTEKEHVADTMAVINGLTIRAIKVDSDGTVHHMNQQ